MADSNDRAFRSAFGDYLALAQDFFISGAVITATPSGTSTVYGITAGHLFYKGELLPVEVHDVTKLSSQVVYIDVQDDAVDVAPVLNLDGNTDYVMRKRHARLRVASVYPTEHMAITAPRKEELDRLRLKGRIVVPGVILPYFGAMDNFSSTGLGAEGSSVDGWAVCNGLNGTPDMRGMVPMGATQVPDTGSAAVYAGVGANTDIGDKVGADMPTLSVDQLPEHTHPITFPSEQYPSALQPGSAQFDAGTSHPYQEFPTDTEVNATSADPLDVRQSSFALVFIMSIV
jgi:hypothetical protein